MFKRKDVDNSGTSDVAELEQCLQLIGLYPTQKELKFFIKAFDKNGDGQLQISELVDHVPVLVSHSLTIHDVIDAFKVLDLNGDGFIRLVELRKVLCHEDFMSGEEAAKVLTELQQHFDKNGDGKFSYAEFVEMFLSETFKKKVLTAIH